MTHPAAAAAASESPAQHHEPDEASEQPDGFTLWAVLRRDPTRPFDLEEPNVEWAVSELESAVAEVEADGVTLRGFYDVSGFKSDADIMVWLHGPVAERLQAGLRRLRRPAGGGHHGAPAARAAGGAVRGVTGALRLSAPPPR